MVKPDGQTDLHHFYFYFYQTDGEDDDASWRIKYRFQWQRGAVNILERWTYKLQNSFINSFHGDELQFKSIHFNFKTVLFTMKLYH